MKGMRRQRPGMVFLIGLVFFFVAAVVSFGRQPQENTSGKKEQKRYVRQTDPSLYVGSETCKTCHEDMPSKGFFKSYEDSPHYVTMLDTKRGPEWHGCEACHGPGKAHVDGGGDKTKIFTFKNASSQEINARCLDCHAGGPQHMNALNSEHTRNDVSCISCHSPHKPQTKEFLLA